MLIIRRQNDALAAQAMLEGASWLARAFDHSKKVWVERWVRASPACLELLTSISSGVSNARPHGTGRPRGMLEWVVDLSTESDSFKSWASPSGELLRKLGSAGLLDLYNKWWGCGRASGDAAKCQDDRCPRCWNSRNRGLVHNVLSCSNTWTGAPARVSGGTGNIRGAVTKDGATEGSLYGWILVPPPNAVDVEIYYNRKALNAKKEGPAGTCTLGKVAFMFDHVGNPTAETREGVVTKWVAVAEYATVGRGSREKLDPATGHPVLRLRSTLAYFPADAIRRVAHMYHKCPDGKTCGPLVRSGGGVVWHHEFGTLPEFLYNRHFHGPTPSERTCDQVCGDERRTNLNIVFLARCVAVTVRWHVSTGGYSVGLVFESICRASLASHLIRPYPL